MLLTLALLVAAVEPSPAPEMTEGGGGAFDLNTLIPLVTGAGGALVVLLLILYLFSSDRITTVGAVDRLRTADNNRFNDMVAQRDALVLALERANSTAAQATMNAQQSLSLLHEVMQPPPPPRTPRKRS